MSGKIRFFYDKIMKYIASNNINSFLLFFGIECFPIYQISNEIIEKTLDKVVLDFPVFTLNGILNIEFQIETRRDDEERFRKYILQLYERYDYDIHFVVIDFGIEKDEKRIYSINQKDQLTIHFKSLIQRNPDKVLNTIMYKLENRIGSPARIS